MAARASRRFFTAAAGATLIICSHNEAPRLTIGAPLIEEIPHPLKMCVYHSNNGLLRAVIFV